MSADTDERPDPDALLKAIEKRREGKGRLKIFFGMAAGVGKTFAMLMEARRLKQEGTDVVIGYLESHQRKETNDLAADLEVVPRMTVTYRGMALQEMDTDAIVAREAAARAGGRAGAHQCARGAQPQTLPGRPGADGARHRRVHHGERPAPRGLRGHGGGDHRRHHRGAHPRLGLRRRRPGRADRSFPRGAPEAALRGQGVPRRPGPGGRARTSSRRARSRPCGKWRSATRPSWSTTSSPTCFAGGTQRQARRHPASASWWPSARARTPPTSSAGRGSGPSTSRRSGPRCSWTPAPRWAMRPRSRCERT